MKIRGGFITNNVSCFAAIFILFFLIAACIQDVKSKKISNYLILPGLLSGVLYQILYCGLAGLINGFAGVFLPILLLLPLLFLHALGAADIKLFSVIGCFLGGKKVFLIIVAAFIFGGVYAFLYLIFKTIRKKTFPNIFRNYRFPGKDFAARAIERRKNTIYFSIPILLSTIAEMGGFF